MVFGKHQKNFNTLCSCFRKGGRWTDFQNRVDLKIYGIPSWCRLFLFKTCRPHGYNLPLEYTKLVADCSRQREEENQRIWICKPVGQSQGRGIFLFRVRTDIIIRPKRIRRLAKPMLRDNNQRRKGIKDSLHRFANFSNVCAFGIKLKKNAFLSLLKYSYSKKP